EVRLDDVGGLELEHLAELVPYMDSLAGRDRNLHLARDLRQRTHVLGRHRLLDPAGPVGLELARDRDRLRRREAAVHLDEDLTVGSDPVADRLHEADRAPELRVGELLPGGAERVELHGAVALAQSAPRGVAKLFGR